MISPETFSSLSHPGIPPIRRATQSPKEFYSALGNALTLFALWGLLAACSPPVAPSSIPVARQGVLDLRTWDFRKPIELRGEWEFWWDQLVVDPVGPALRTMEVPARWSQVAGDGHRLPGNGKATYRITVLLPDQAPTLGLRIREVDRAFRLWVNGQEVATGFRVGDSIDQEGGMGYSRQFYFQENGRLTLLFQISSHYDSWGGGFPYAPVLGSASSIASSVAYGMALEVFLAGILLIMGFYHLVLFLISRKDGTLLLFGLICLASSLRTVAMNEVYIFTAISVPDFWIRRLAWGSGYLLILLYPIFVDGFFPVFRIRALSDGLVGFGALMVLICATGSQAVFGCGPVLHVYLVAVIVYVVVLLCRAIGAGRPFGWALLAGSLSAGLPGLIDVLTITVSWLPLFIAPFGLLPFLLILSYILAQRYTQGTREAEHLRITNSKLAELDRAKTNFFANVSHELRTPLTLILGPLESIQKGDFGPNLPPSHPVFRLMRTNTARILKLTENLLRFTEMEARSAPRPQVVNVPETLAKYVDAFEPAAQAKAVSLKLESHLERSLALLDVQDLETIVFNLLSNGLKYTGKGGSVLVSAESTEGRRWKLIVADSGIGISQEQQTKLFERFRRVYDMERVHFEGTGLGLAISKEAALRMGGDLSVTSALGQGSRFCVDLPWTEPPWVAEGAVVEPSQAARNLLVSDLSVPASSELGLPLSSAMDGRCVLLVEDNDDLRHYLVAYLSREFHVLAARNGGEGLDLLSQGTSVDLIVSDIMMPQMDGLTFLDRVREIPQVCNTPFLFLTARASDEEKLAQLNKGVTDYLVKPFSPEELKARIRTILDQRVRLKKDLEHRIAVALSLAQTPAPEPRLHSAEPQRFGLSAREIQVVDEVLRGRSDKEIAAALGMSQRTASNHVANILKKTGKRSRFELMELFLSAGVHG